MRVHKLMVVMTCTNIMNVAHYKHYKEKTCEWNERFSGNTLLSVGYERTGQIVYIQPNQNTFSL